MNGSAGAILYCFLHHAITGLVPNGDRTKDVTIALEHKQASHFCPQISHQAKRGLTRRYGEAARFFQKIQGALCFPCVWQANTSAHRLSSISSFRPGPQSFVVLRAQADEGAFHRGRAGRGIFGSQHVKEAEVFVHETVPMAFIVPERDGAAVPFAAVG